MTDTKTHRQFWIVPENDTMWIQSVEKFNPEHFDDNDYFKKENPIHVVEHSALLAEQKKVEQLQAELKNAKLIVNSYESDNVRLNEKCDSLKTRLLDFEGKTYSENNEITKLKEANKILKDAVERTSGDDLYAREALASADKIMGDEK